MSITGELVNKNHLKQCALEEPLTKRAKDIRCKTIDLAKPNGGYHFGGKPAFISLKRDTQI
jgi:hypothetical protein